MSTSDRTQLKDVLVGSLGSLRSVVNAILCVAQDAQRFQAVDVGAGATTAATNYTFPLARVDRPVQIIGARILPGGALTYNVTNYVTISYGWTNDNSTTVTLQGGIGAGNTAANGAAGNWTFGTSIAVPPNTLVNAIVPSGSQLAWTVVPTGVGLAIPGGTVFQLLWEEV